MCEFCHEHGEGKKWYLQAENYSKDLQSDLMKRMNVTNSRELISLGRKGFMRKQYDKLSQRPEWLQKLLKPYLVRYLTNRQKVIHFGQVIPLEDVGKVFDITNAIVRIACVCRKSTSSKDERYCYGISMGPPEDLLQKLSSRVSRNYDSGPDTSSLEALSKEEAMASFLNHEREDCIYTIWTAPTPFITGLCNCDRWDCLALRSTLSGGIGTLFKAEYVAEVDPELCNGCRQCMRVCQYGAIGSSSSQKKVFIDPLRCAGCGICRASCTRNAITLKDRTANPVAADIW